MSAGARGRLAAACGLLLAAACAGPSLAHKQQLNRSLAARDYKAAEATLLAVRGEEYGERNAVLFYLDMGAVLFDAERHLESDAWLDQAEQRIDELYTRSISQAVGTFVINDNTEEYGGEAHERAMLHVLRALNYAHLARVDDAAVEARKVSAFLADLSDRSRGRWSYRDDAFAQYLAAMLFEDAGKEDDARICYTRAREAYALYGELFGTPDPLLDLGPLAPGEGELVVVHLNGIAPRRESQTFQFAWGEAAALVRYGEEGRADPRLANAFVAGMSANAVTVAFPVYVQEPFQVQESLVEAGGQSAPTLLVEDASAIARKALEDKVALIRIRALTRAILKAVAARAAEDAARRQGGEGFGMLAGLLARATAAATEVADTRAWGSLPAQVRMARIRLPQGSYGVAVRYLGRDGRVLSQDALPGVQVSAGRRTYAHIRTAF